MKKALAYVTTAVLLGFAVMMLPLALQIGPSAFQSPLSPMNQQNRYTPPGDTMKGAEYSALQFCVNAGQPATLIPSSLVLFSGLIVALAMYFLLKKRMS